MSLKGGYKIIDLKGVDVTKNTMIIKGIYESIESNYGKPLLISGIVINGVEKDDVFVQATLNGTAYEFEIYGYTIQIQDTDAVGVFQDYEFVILYNGAPIYKLYVKYNSNESNITDYLLIKNILSKTYVNKNYYNYSNSLFNFKLPTNVSNIDDVVYITQPFISLSTYGMVETTLAFIVYNGGVEQVNVIDNETLSNTSYSLTMTKI